ncbi:MAG TPA: hypothetical protein VJB67_03250 [Patescibacteria group bacterium]|nr:hypothetical protein [Patescibacteria group bacterium]
MEDTALYRPALKGAWQITKRLKNLWFFGLFAAIIGSSGEYEILASAIYNPYNIHGIFTDIIDSFKAGWQNGLNAGNGFLSNLWGAITQSPQSLIIAGLIMIVAIIVTIFIIWLAVISQIGLIKNSELASKKKTPTLNDGINYALDRFWPVLTANIVFKVVLSVLFLIIGKEIILLSNPNILSKLLYYLSFMIFIAIIFVISFIIRYQIFYIVLKKQKLMSSFSSAWSLFKKNWLVSLEMAFILFLIYVIVIFFTTLISTLLLAVPFVLPVYYSIPLWLAGGISIVALLLLLILTLAVTAVLSTFQWLAWIIIFNQLDSSMGLSKIIRVSQKLPEYFKKS